MRRSGGDGQPGAEPGPAELWISAGSGDPGGYPAGPIGPTGPIAGPPAGGGPGGGPPAGGAGHGAPTGSGGSGRARWIALAAGFVVLVAVIAVQHFAGTRPAATSETGPSSIVTPTPTSNADGACSGGAVCEQLAGTSATASQAAPDTPTVSAPESLDQPTPIHDAPPTVGSMEQTIAITDGPDDAAPSTPGQPPPTEEPSSDAGSPLTSAVPSQAMRSSGDWELVGYDATGVIRYRPATGKVVTIPVPELYSDGLLSFVATTTSAIIRPMDPGIGYLVPAGRPAVPLTGRLSSGARVLPGPDPDHLWVAVTDGSHTSLVLVTANGAGTGTVIRLPAMLARQGAYDLTPDGAGYALAHGIGGTYDIRPDGAHLVTHGAVLAAGRTAFLVYECDDTARCTTSVIDRATGRRRAGPALGPVAQIGIVGVISPDGRYAALLQVGQGVRVGLVDLRTGRIQTPAVDLGVDMIAGDLSSSVVFSPDSRTLLVANSSVSLTPVDTGTGKLLTPLPLPPMSALAVVPGH